MKAQLPTTPLKKSQKNKNTHKSLKMLVSRKGRYS